MDEKVTKTVTKLLRHHFTEKEKMELGQELSEQVSELHRVQDAKKAVTSQFASQINELSARVNQIAEKVRSGFEMRERECHILVNYDTKEVSVWDPEEEQIIEQRTMTSEELQLGINFEEQQEQTPYGAPSDEPAEIDSSLDEEIYGGE